MSHLPSLPGSLCLLLLGASLAGCTLVDLEPEPLVIFDLRQPAVLPAGDRRGARGLAVAQPVAFDPVAGERIAVRSGNGSLGVLAGARWAGSAPRLFQDLLLRGLEDAGAAPFVIRAGEGASADCHLAGDLRAFEYLPEEARVRVLFRARLDCGEGGGRAARAFEAR
ncbi:MAG: ABC-type transport auxiliary lipoprotein family protein, partial [Pseudomonadales bacterium]|nr:ABC-type transport auxiliary lipoprotein family protein [Pseudomonadales bacterium]